MTNLLAAPTAEAVTNLRGEEAAALLRAFPPRPQATSWPATQLPGIQSSTASNGRPLGLRPTVLSLCGWAAPGCC
jgi:hypothetical protein